jgi:CRISPR-associated endonuclease Cas3-HD
MWKMNIEYFAHSENDFGKKHNLLDHLKKNARIAESFTNNKEFANFFQFAGLIHDFGKYQPDFQQYLVEGGKRGSVPHSAWGAGYGIPYPQPLSVSGEGQKKYFLSSPNSIFTL